MSRRHPPFLAAFLGILAAMFMTFVGITPLLAQQQPAAQNASVKPPEKLDELIKLLQDPDIRTWIETQKKSQLQSVPVADADEMQMWKNRARSKFKAAELGMPKLLSELAAASERVRNEAFSRGFPPVGVIVALMLIASLAGEWVVRRLMRRVREEGSLVNKTYAALAAAGTFVAIAVLAFFGFEWPPMAGAVIFYFVIAATVLRTVVALGSILIAAEQLTVFVFWRAILFCSILLIAFSLNILGTALSVDPNVSLAAGFVGSIILIAICCEVVWRRPGADTSVGIKVFLTIFLLALWLLWAASFHLLCWIGLVAIILPGLLSSMQGLAKALTTARWPDEKHTSLKAVLIIHSVRTLVLAAAIGWLAFVWKSNPNNVQLSNTYIGTATTGLFRSMAVLLVADFGWRVVRTLIDRRLESSATGDVPLSPEEMARRARLRTLLPIMRNGLAAVVLVIAALTVLAELGVQIGPLIAGAGIFGVALGFGAQTLVKDVISGVFYLMDDAFRVGEYIQSGSYKGTVESFSLRSIKLRHHRGPVFTVPFGELGAVQNMSRDWVIDKFLLRVTFDADVAKAKKLTKVIGAELSADEEIGKHIIETLKMKGVERINEYGIELAFAFTAAPGWQAVIRRRAYLMIRKAFLDNGIHFAQPTVQVGGDEKSEAAAAALTLAALQKQAAAPGGAAAPE